MEAARIRVELSREPEERSYDILIRDGALRELGEYLLPLPKAESYFIVSDSNVAKLYGKALQKRLSLLGAKTELLSFRAGEARKTAATALTMASRLSVLGAGRDSVILALGGGVVGDVAGFVVSIYKRGVGYVQLPTTLLAQVDSSIGGKTGVDTSWGKNQIGTFHQPLQVVVDPETLWTLPKKEMVNGLAEIVKCAIVADKKMFERMFKLDFLASGVPREFILGACRVKAEVVSKDEKESNLRAILNYGHTVGHAIESASGYRMGHGVCVVLGMVAEGSIANRMGILRQDDLDMQNQVLARLFRDSGARLPPFSESTLLKFARADKKSTSSSLRMSLPERIGRMHAKDGSYKIPVSDQDFNQSIAGLREVLPRQDG